MTRDRYFFAFIFFICAILSGVAFYYNYVQRVPVCPLCSLQLLCYYIIGITALCAFFVTPEKYGRLFYVTSILFFAVIGAIFASRQVWMQHYAAQYALPCGPGAGFLFTHFSFIQAFSAIYNRVDTCSMNHWSFINLSMAAWSLIFYVIVIISSVAALFTKDETAQSRHIFSH